jgi:hypothetical protein
MRGYNSFNEAAYRHCPQDASSIQDHHQPVCYMVVSIVKRLRPG